MKKLSDQEKQRHRERLAEAGRLRNADRPQAAEALTRQVGCELLVYGAEGVAWWIHESIPGAKRYGVKLFGPGDEIPADCPWTPVDGKGAVTGIFHPLEGQALPAVRLLGKYCKGTYPFLWNEHWRLLYVLDVSAVNPGWKFRLLSGDPPITKPSPSPVMSTYNWEVPPDLKAFYAVHGGFGDYEDDYQLALSPSILPPDRLDVMADSVPPGTPGIHYDTRDLLLFSPDGAGGGQCFRRIKKRAAYSYETVGWDHEGGVLSPPSSFWDFWHSFLEQKISS